jgi:hypothetical protein
MTELADQPLPAEQGAVITLMLEAVVVAVTDEAPRILIVPWEEDGAEAMQLQRRREALPHGWLEPDRDRTLERALRDRVHRQTGLQLGYVEQLYTFGDACRHSRERQGGARVMSVAYLALVREQHLLPDAHWRNCYDYFPWEDWRAGRPDIITEVIEPALRAWLARQTYAEIVREELRERIEISFGFDAPWDPERVLERYELLYQAGLVEEAHTADIASTGASLPGRPMAQDHRRILATALGRLRGKIKYRPVVFELLPAKFTLYQLQVVAEALAGARLHKQNFRRLVEHTGLVVNTGEYQSLTGGRPAQLFSFRRQVLRERPAPGVGLPRSG